MHIRGKKIIVFALLQVVLILGVFNPVAGYSACNLQSSTLSPHISLSLPQLQEFFVDSESFNILNDIQLINFPKNIDLIVNKKANNLLAGRISRKLSLLQEEFVIATHKDGESMPVIINPRNVKGKNCLITHVLGKTEG